MIRFCCQCAGPVRHEIPPGDNRLRALCPNCGHIQYENPRLVVGCIAEYEEHILLCRRAIEPRKGFWTLPAGFMENGESTAAAAARETFEEACAVVDQLRPFALVSVPHISQVHLFFHGHLSEGRHAPGEESQATRLFSPCEIPSQVLAFRSVRYALERYLVDRECGHFAFHETELTPQFSG